METEYSKQEGICRLTNGSNIFIVTTADVIASRKPANVGLMQNLEKKIAFFNKHHNPIVPLYIFAGDEIQGVWKSNTAIFNILIEFLKDIFPLRLRIGIGIGKINGTLNINSGMMNGPAFENARNALNKAGHVRQRIQIQGWQANDIHVNLTLDLIMKIIERWDAVTYRRYMHYRQYGTLSEIARNEKVSVEAINKMLNRYAIREVASALDYLDDLLLGDISTNNG